MSLDDATPRVQASPPHHIPNPLGVHGFVWAEALLRIDIDFGALDQPLVDARVHIEQLEQGLANLRHAYITLATAYTATSDAAIEVAEIFGDGMFADQVGGHLSCTEAEVLATLLISVGRSTDAEAWISGHAEGDDEGDSHFKAPRPAGGDSDSLARRDG